MTTLFDARLYGRFRETKNNLRSEKLHTANQDPNFKFLETALVMKTMYGL